ncbi:hypothetical protein ACSS6W_010663 [Trichoderma asperelloides]
MPGAVLTTRLAGNFPYPSLFGTFGLQLAWSSDPDYLSVQAATRSMDSPIAAVSGPCIAFPVAAGPLARTLTQPVKKNLRNSGDRRGFRTK